MHLPTYPLSSPGRIGIYEFVSEGEKGRIKKQIVFSLAPGLDKGYKNTYNLAFGDVIDDEGGISDISISDNGDRDKILATVVSAVYEFINQEPDAKIYFRGSTPSRTRLYRMSISKYHTLLCEDFYIYGELGDNWHPFDKNAPSEAFLVFRKQASTGWQPTIKILIFPYISLEKDL